MNQAARDFLHGLALRHTEGLLHGQGVEFQWSGDRDTAAPTDGDHSRIEQPITASNSMKE